MAMADPGGSGLVALARVRWASSGGQKACDLACSFISTARP